MPSLPYREARHFLFAMDYTSKRWKHLRARVLREQPLCQEAQRYGRREPATVAHHVYPVEDFPGWRFCRWNLIAVSVDAHNSFHDRVTGKLTERGLAWQRRVSPPRHAPPPFWQGRRRGALCPTAGKPRGGVPTRPPGAHTRENLESRGAGANDAGAQRRKPSEALPGAVQLGGIGDHRRCPESFILLF